MDFIVRFDNSILTWVTQNMHNSVMDFFMILFSKLGDGGIFWIAAALAMTVSKKYRKYGVCMLSALLFTVVMGEGVLKNIFRRDRPFVVDPGIQLIVPVPTGHFSFPSGHAASSFTAAFVFTKANRKFAPIYILSALIAFSRIYLSLHYPSDILAGALLGTIDAFLVCFIAERLLARKSDKSTKEAN